jgi:hypothetical protein
MTTVEVQQAMALIAAALRAAKPEVPAGQVPLTVRGLARTAGCLERVLPAPALFRHDRPAAGR